MTSNSGEMHPGGRREVHLSISPLVLGDYPMYTLCTLYLQQLSIFTNNQSVFIQLDEDGMGQIVEPLDLQDHGKMI